MIFGKKNRPVIRTDQTGLPELPAGYWWRVSKTTVTSGYDSWPYQIEIRNAKERVVRKGFSDMSDSGVLAAARSLHYSFKRRLKRLENEKRLLGDYPPNRIGEAND